MARTSWWSLTQQVTRVCQLEPSLCWPHDSVSSRPARWAKGPARWTTSQNNVFHDVCFAFPCSSHMPSLLYKITPAPLGSSCIYQPLMKPCQSQVPRVSLANRRRDFCFSKEFLENSLAKSYQTSGTTQWGSLAIGSPGPACSESCALKVLYLGIDVCRKAGSPGRKNEATGSLPRRVLG